MSTTIPEELRPLVDEPHYGVLGTIRPDGAVQVNPMWFRVDGDHVLFTHTTTRQKYRNLQHNPTMSLAVFDPAQPYRYVELRGVLDDVVPDPQAAFFLELAARYGDARTTPPEDAADRVILRMRIDRVSGQ